MKYVPRAQEKQLKELFKTFPVVVVTGARQVGKSTLLTHLFPDLPHVLFDPTVDVENVRADPDLFLRNRKTPLILDEIQYAPELVSAIKRTLEKDRRPGQYLMTGSQQWNVMKKLSESLAGRAVFLDLEGFSCSEMARITNSPNWLDRWLAQGEGIDVSSFQTFECSFPLFEYLWRGSLPEAHFLPLQQLPVFFTAYQRTYIERDVRQLAEIEDQQLFGRFFRLCAALTAQEVNFSQLGRDIGVTPQTASRWLDILKATFQWFEIPPYHGNVIKRLSDKPKGYLADTGMACFAQAISTPEAVGFHPLWGSLFETFVVGEIRKLARTLDVQPHFYHWRAHGGGEVDLLFERDWSFYPI